MKDYYDLKIKEKIFLYLTKKYKFKMKKNLKLNFLKLMFTIVLNLLELL